MQTKNHHSRSYHKFFEDWAEWKTFDECGKMRVERLYVGHYYRSPLNRSQRVLYRVLYVILYLLSVAAFVAGGIRNIPANRAMIPSIAVAVCIFALALLAFPLCRSLFAPEEMIIRQYRASSLDLIRMSGVSAAALAAAALIDLLFLVIADASAVQETIFCALSYLAAAGFALILHLLERRLDYEIIAPRNSRPENSTVIRFESAQQQF